MPRLCVCEKTDRLSLTFAHGARRPSNLVDVQISCETDHACTLAKGVSRVYVHPAVRNAFQAAVIMGMRARCQLVPNPLSLTQL